MVSKVAIRLLRNVLSDDFDGGVFNRGTSGIFRSVFRSLVCMRTGKIRIIARSVVVWGLTLTIFLLLADRHVTLRALEVCFSEPDSIPEAHVGIVLGTSPKLVNGQTNLFFKHRIKAAADLYHSGKIDRVLVSGDNRTIHYNEPVQMQKALVEAGVPKDRIHLDFAGLRTLDSMVRAREVFDQDTVIVISQPFHNQRAVYIARHHGITAWGYNAEEVGTEGGALRVRLREVLARTRMLLDLYVLGTGPRHLGPQEEIPRD